VALPRLEPEKKRRARYQAVKTLLKMCKQLENTRPITLSASERIQKVKESSNNFRVGKKRKLHQSQPTSTQSYSAESVNVNNE
jgi:hypothetical protein